MVRDKSACLYGYLRCLLRRSGRALWDFLRPQDGASGAPPQLTSRKVHRERQSVSRLTEPTDFMPSLGIRSPTSLAAAAFFIGLILNTSPAAGCGPGKFGGRRRIPRKLTPLVFKQHVPNLPETSLSASGLFEGQITRDHPRFKDLVPNYSTDIDFKDEEGDAQDRIMTPRCKEKLNTLAISVMNLYPGVRLRVTEGWDDEGYHSKNSLHFEGRAVDLTTSDRDRSKYGMLGRLAVEAGFDFVYYESRNHIHASCKSESADAARFGGCFNGKSTVETPTGLKKMSEVAIGDNLLVTKSDGTFDFSEVILFLDRDEEQKRLYLNIVTESGANITMTPSHLLFTQEDNITADFSKSYATFAKNINVGDYIYLMTANTEQSVERELVLDQVTNITIEYDVGVFAPLTSEGNVVVNNILASVYAILDDQTLAHWAFWPMRMAENFRQASYHFFKKFHIIQLRTSKRTVKAQKGVHWYAAFLYKASYLFKKYLYN